MCHRRTRSGAQNCHRHDNQLRTCALALETSLFGVLFDHNDAVDERALKVGDSVSAVIKSSDVMIGKQARKGPLHAERRGRRFFVLKPPSTSPQRRVVRIAALCRDRR